jgi:hypothetical protein
LPGFYWPKTAHINKLPIISAMAEIPEWQVHHASVYHTYEVEAADHLSMGVSLYTPPPPNPTNDGEFRIAILGGDDEEVCVPAIDVYHVLPQEVAGTMLHFSFSSMKTLLPGNSTSCPWQDANTLIRKFAYTNPSTLTSELDNFLPGICTPTPNCSTSYRNNSHPLMSILI